MIVKTEAIVLNSRKFGDSSKIISVFSYEFGRISLMAKGARASKSKYGSALEPLSRIEITFYRKGEGELQLLSSADLVKPYTRISSTIEKMAVGLMILESVAYLTSEHQPFPELYDYLAVGLDLLNTSDENIFNIFIAVQFKLAEVLGFWLQFDYMHDEKPISDGYLNFSLEDGAPVFSSKISGKNFKFTSMCAYTLEQIYRREFADSIKIPNNERLFKEMVRFFQEYFTYHLERNFVYKSYSLLTV